MGHVTNTSSSTPEERTAAIARLMAEIERLEQAPPACFGKRQARRRGERRRLSCSA
jgi:hypothetical protein